MYEERCCCGNILGEARCKVTIFPCKCNKPGPGRRRAPTPWISDEVSEKHYDERVKAGLPIETDVEHAAFREQWR